MLTISKGGLIGAIIGFLLNSLTLLFIGRNISEGVVILIVFSYIATALIGYTIGRIVSRILLMNVRRWLKWGILLLVLWIIFNILPILFIFTAGAIVAMGHGDGSGGFYVVLVLLLPIAPVLLFFHSNSIASYLSFPLFFLIGALIGIIIQKIKR